MTDGSMSIMRFDEFAERINETVIPEKSDLNRFIGPEHIDSMDLKIRKWDEDRNLKGKKLIVRKGDIIIAKRRWYLRRVAVSPFDALCSAHTLIVRPRKNVILPEFLPFFLLGEQFFNKGIEISVGSLSPTINWTQLKSLEFDIPPISTQKKIVKILREINKTIDLYRISYEKIEYLISKLGSNLLSNYDRNKSITDICEINPTSINKVQLLENREWHYYQLSSIDFPNIISNVETISIGESTSRARRVIQKSDVLISTVRPNLKKFCIVSDIRENLVASTGFCCLRPNKNTHSSLILGIYLSPQFEQFVNSRAKGSSYPAITVNDIMKFKIPDIYSNDFYIINELFSNLFINLNSVNVKIDNLTKIRDKIFQINFDLGV